MSLIFFVEQLYGAKHAQPYYYSTGHHRGPKIQTTFLGTSKIASDTYLLNSNDKLSHQYDEHKKLDARAGDEMRELYDALSTDNGEGEIYLSDGLWLSNDGSVHDRGR